MTLSGARPESVTPRTPAEFVAERKALLARPGLPGPGRRRALADATDDWLREMYAAALPGAQEGVALAAVGGHGRGSLSPASDLDLVLLHDGARGPEEVARVAEALWYPIWDSGLRLDYSVRTPGEARKVASQDLSVLLGLLDLRVVAGSEALGAKLRSAVLDDWRSSARGRLGELLESCRERWRRAGEVAFLLEPELKEGRGGLRDVVALRAVAASWVADRPHGDLDGAAERLLDVRDALHLSSGRALDKLLLQEQDAVAAALGIADADSVLRVVADAARTIAYAGDTTWRRVEQLLAPRRRSPLFTARRPPRPRILAPGLAEHEGELVLGRDGVLDTDPVLPLRAAAVAAQAGLPLSPGTAERLAASSPRMPEPWPQEARDALVTFLGAGAGTVRVWEALDQAGVIEALLPEWALVRNRPQRTPVHRWTVDRHSVETCVQAASLTRRVTRPDLLLVAALLHDIGKGKRRGDHAREGAVLAGPVLARLGFAPADAQVVVTLVREHLLLVDTATRRDIDDPATAVRVADAVGSVEVLDLLATLTEADALAAGPAAWSDWRAGLVAELTRRVRAHLRGEPPPPATPLTPEQLALVDQGDLAVAVRPEGGGWAVTVVAPDRRGLLSTVAGVLALHRLSVRSAALRTERGIAVDTWSVTAEFGDPPVLEALRDDIDRALDRRLDVAALLERREASRPPARGPKVPASVEVVEGASESATVLEVRASDRLGLLHRLGRALAYAGIDVRSARVATLGAEAVDVFYVVDGDGSPLVAERAREVSRILRDVAS
ncbi:UTP--GlnB (protein PII) uridylyltransferase GlnD [Motilibacter rhizosphaerae]|uniref:Bifunctional uridylyltransferase/uridylyl-removing enzyme n=1 Tax=Motilibacter rhizosphaerae TaxID=598652 RepID=A0A4Q7NP00_9ACTN|nr:[protein-PII] uridylyltransferase [Motilibacter rhizosphaerae]RZS86994.1 UTP--GlnB (protein PII) uridylyltransferase GlnD [Motilibacter rhizosphaerae]